MRRRMMASVGGGAKKKPTARDYVQSGLIAMWDGIENAGWGTHDSAATVWKDLVGGYDLSIGTASFEANNLSCAKGYASYGTKIPCVFVEVVCEATTGIVCSGTGNVKAFTSLTEIEYATQSRVIGEFSGVYNIASVNAKLGAIFINGIRQTPTGKSSGYSDGTFFEIGGRDGTRNRYLGRVYAVRLYGTYPTADEIAANYAVDKERFGLA